MAVNVGQAEVAPLELVRQPLVVDAQQMQQRGVQVADVDGGAGDVVAIVVRFAEGRAGFDARPGQSDAEAARVVVVRHESGQRRETQADRRPREEDAAVELILQGYDIGSRHWRASIIWTADTL
jgi:hypothetical protein